MKTGPEVVAAHEPSFRTRPYAHQRQDSAALVDNEAFGLFSEMGTGKTKTVVDAACCLREEGRIDAVLVLAPAAVRAVWANPYFGEIRRHCWVPSCVLEFHSPVRLAWKDEGARLYWVVTNYEFLRGKSHEEELVKLLHGQRFMMVLDESAFIKSRQAVQTKAVMRVARLAARRVLLNGTPIANNPLDLWSQAQFLGPRVLPYANFPHFRSEFAVLDARVRAFPKIIAWKNLDRLQDHMAPYVVRREKKDCLDLPEKVALPPAEVSLTEDTWRVYRQMRDDAVVWLRDNPSMAAQAGVKIMRLSQITSGFLGGFAGDDDPLAADHAKTREIGREKLDWLLGYVRERLGESPSAKMIAWCRFRPELERVAAELKALLPTYRLYGQQSKAERAEAVARFTPGPESRAREGEPALMAAQAHAGGLGQNFVAAHIALYMSNDFSLYHRQQSEDRIHRPGQTVPVLIGDVLATGPKGQRTVDHAVVTALRAKADVATWTCLAWKKALEEE